MLVVVVIVVVVVVIAVVVVEAQEALTCETCALLVLFRLVIVRGLVNGVPFFSATLSRPPVASVFGAGPSTGPVTPARPSAGTSDDGAAGASFSNSYGSTSSTPRW